MTMMKVLGNRLPAAAAALSRRAPPLVFAHAVRVVATIISTALLFVSGGAQRLLHARRLLWPYGVMSATGHLVAVQG